MSKWTFYNPTQVIQGQLERLPELVNHLKDVEGPVVIVTGRNSSKKNGSLDKVKAALNHFEVLVFDKVEPEPSHETIMAGKGFVENVGASLVIALGGGSPIDAAKAICCLAYTKLHITPIMDRELVIKSRAIPLIAIPTTAGTGSEVTPYSVLTNVERRLKQSIATPYYYPDYAILVPEFISSVPQKTIADVGIDTLAHAFEAIWSLHSQPISQSLAFEAIRLIKENLNIYYNTPDNTEAASKVQMASTIAGFAFSNTFTAACHALSFPIGERFKLTHGHSCAMTLHLIAEANQHVVVDKFERLATYLNLEDRSIPRFISSIRNSVHTETRFTQFGATQEDLDFIAKNAFRPLLNNNPVDFSHQELVAILNNAM